MSGFRNYPHDSDGLLDGLGLRVHGLDEGKNRSKLYVWKSPVGGIGGICRKTLVLELIVVLTFVFFSSFAFLGTHGLLPV